MIYVDPPRSFLNLIPPGKSDSADLCVSVIRCPEDVFSFTLNDQIVRPTNGEMLCAQGDDPWIEIPLSLQSEVSRYCVLTMACKAQAESAKAQLYWSGDKRPGYSEELSVHFPLVADSREHTYLVDLHEGSYCGSINYRWRKAGLISRVRFDPLNTPGQFSVQQMCFLSEEYFWDDELRVQAGLSPARRELSFRYLNGYGIEIGALQNPLAVPNTSYVDYADRLSREGARKEYPELADSFLVNPSLICDADSLPVPDRSADFVIANHVVEHMRDPLRAIQEWLRVLRYGGHLYIAAPEHTNPLDKHRSVTRLEHIIADFEKRKKRTAEDLAHFSEWVASVNFGMPGEEQALRTKELIAKDYAIHFHTFNRDSYCSLLREATRRFGGDLLEFRVSRHPQLVEFIAILRK